MPKLTTTRLTTSTCRSLGTGDHPDSEVRGLTLRVTEAGGRSFTLRYQVKEGGERRQKRVNLGKLGELSLAQARKRAMDLKSGVNHGEDPSAERAQLRGEPTISELAEMYIAARDLKPASIRNYGYILRLHILPLFGDMQPSQVSSSQLRDFYKELSKTAKVQAGVAIKLLRAIFNWAIKFDHIKCENPAKQVEVASEIKRKRYLDRDERQRFWSAMDSIERDSSFHPPLILALRVLAWTGARRREITALKWEEIDWEEKLIAKIEHKTDQHDEVRNIYLCDAALEILLKRKEDKREGDLYVFPAKRAAGEPVDFLHGVWIKMLEESKITNFRVHDLRHSFASDALSGGASLAQIGAVLGHSSPRTTARYAHLCSDTAREIVSRAEVRIRAD